MPRPQRPWFRFYVEAIGDAKLRRLTPGQRWLWVCVLAAARQSPQPGLLLISEELAVTARDLADMSGLTVKQVDQTMTAFLEANMVGRWKNEPLAGTWYVTNWDGRQYESDSSAERTARYRHKERRCDVTTAVTVTPPENREQIPPPTPSSVDDGFQPVDGEVAAEGEQGFLEAVVDGIARRQLAATVNVKSPGGWLVAARKRIGTQAYQRIVAHFEQGDSVEETIERLEPTPRSNIRPFPPAESYERGDPENGRRAIGEARLRLTTVSRDPEVSGGGVQA